MAAASPNSYRDPAYGLIEQKVESDLGLPKGMLASIRTRGERSNANQVSEANARTVYQVIPQTRNALIKLHGVDAYAGPEQAARAAGILLKESLARNNGNRAAAFREYHGGTDPDNWGPRTRAYVERTTGGGGQASTGGGTAFDRAKASRQQSTGPDMKAVHRAYLNAGKPGGMTQADAAQYENAVLDGHVMLPRGQTLRVKPAAPVLPKSVVEAYNSHRMDDDPEARAEVKRALDAGEVSLPRGLKLQAPAPRTAGETLGMYARSAGEGLAGLADTVRGVIDPATMLVPELRPDAGFFQRGMEAGADSAGLATPESNTEKLIGAGVSGAAQGLVTGPIGGVRGMLGRTALDAVSGGASGYTQESARQAGAGPVAQVAAGLLGGAAPIGLAAAGERAASRIRAPKSLPEVVESVPRAAVVDETGNLTPEGQEIAARHNVTPEQVVAAYEAPPKVRDATANDQMPEVTAREATTGEPVAEPVPVREAPTDTPELPPQPSAPSVDQPSAPDVAPATALARVQQANEFGFGLSKGQATKDFATQVEEQNLRKMDTPQGEAVRQWTAQNADQVKTAVDEFRGAFGDPNLSAEQRGTAVQEAVRELRDNGQKGVTALYKTARELGQEVPLETAGIRNTIEGLMAEADIPESVKKVMEGEAARYGLIGNPVEIAPGKVTNEANVTTVKLDDGQTIKFRGEPQTLRLDNAEELRQVISKQYEVDGPQKLTRELRTAIDDATEAAATKLAQYGQDGAKVPEALKAAREAHVEQVKTFKAKDIVQSIADWKKGTKTDALKPEQVMQQALAKTSDLKRIKAVLLSKPTVASKAAWRAIQAHGLATVFEKAMVTNGNLAGEVAEVVSGAKLNSAVKDFGADKLKVLLDPEDFNTFMKLRRSIGDATIPIAGTVPVGSAPWWQRLVGSVDNKVTAAFAAAGTIVGGPVGTAIGGGIGKAVGGAVEASSKAKAATATLKGATEYTPEAAAADTGARPPSTASKAKSAVKQAGATTLRAFIDTYGSPRILAPVLASTTGAEQ